MENVLRKRPEEGLTYGSQSDTRYRRYVEVRQRVVTYV